ncbi:MAG: Na/Pi cotransporter family protein [Candidatus Krumholzibacteria bacterium]|jgi:phosphate:Na+ symporter|nr:Na/Pi cotransporter family protein [Candidatus Krumholzibacteria bacterium]MDP6797421.1 Na/Pi cotransporter family protein [Candidatus Krumholzibacteria bacterium]MDP7022174.1 Na/Pi cotransporter family protein [Candidatus Krumholzibacteria bacterium]
MILVVAWALPLLAAQATGLHLSHPTNDNEQRISGDRSTVFVGETLSLKALVRDDSGKAIEGIPVTFYEMSPEERLLGVVHSARSGVAHLDFCAGTSPGKSLIQALIEGQPGDSARITYHIPVRKKSWVLFMIFGLLGGLGLFLFGMEMMSKSMQRSAGSRMRSILGALTKNRFVGLGVGAFVTMLIQSSSATTVMLVSFVQAQLMTFAQTLGVILGADIGTTITAQLVAFRLTDYALLMIGIGFGLRVLSKKEKLRNIGAVALGFGMLFFGMSVMSKSMAPLRSYQPFLDLLANLENPVLGILVGTAFTALIQSSSAFTGIIIVLAQQGFLSLTAGIPLIFGANIGTCVTAALASLNTGREAKRVAIAHTLFKVSGVALMFPFITALAAFVEKLSPGGHVALGDAEAMARYIPRQIANAHTVFNVGLALIFLPFTTVFAKVIFRLMPEKKEIPTHRYRARHLDRSMLDKPALALNLAKVEILRMGEKVKTMAELSIEPFFTNDLGVCDRLHEFEEEIDDLDAAISEYLIDIGKQKISEHQAEEVYLMMHVTKQYEHVADIIDKELRPLARKMATGGIEFSKSGGEEVRAYHLKMLKQVARSLETFTESSLKMARKMEQKQERYVALEGDYRQAHFERISKAVEESVQSSEIHLDLMDFLRRINSYTANIARAILTHSGKE